ncbi:MAG: ABC transporter permease [Lewinellaceae bacterium]|nr:ABC transporter permease [Saprospiraceae bacterium]MCB9331959.1 ABC transporter permease [Lewinellaceae bacterium]
MLIPNLKIAVRNLLNGRVYSFINLFGLSVGSVVVLLLALYVRDEWTFDQFHEKSDRIYRAWVKEHYQGEVFFNTVTPVILGQELRENFPEIQRLARYLQANTLVKKDNFSEQEQVLAVDPEFLQMFDFKLIRGKKNQALKQIHQVVITEAMGEKYFGDPFPMGRTLTMKMDDQWTDYTVSGIIEKAPGNSSIQYDLLIPFENTKAILSVGGRTSWTTVNVETYVLMGNTNAIADLEAKVAPFVDGKVADDYKPGEYIVGFQPLRDIHLNRAFPTGIALVSDARYPKILAGVALLILLLASINFITIAIGRSVSRAKDVGVRKVIGASKKQLMAQFWTEAVLTTSLAVLVGVILAKAALPFFNNLTDKQLEFGFTPQNILGCITLTLVLSLLSGAYPAMLQAGFSPIRALHGTVSKVGTEKHLMLRGLVGFQFLLSILLITCTFVMAQQLHFLQTKNLGFDREQVVVLPYTDPGIPLTKLNEVGQQVSERLRHELVGKPGFIDLSCSNHTFGTPGWMKVGYTDEKKDVFRNFFVNGIDARFIPMMDIHLAEGRNPNPAQNAADAKAVVINEAYSKAFGIRAGEPMQAPFQEYNVVGVSNDFNFESLHSKVEPLVLAVEPVGLVRIASDITMADAPNPKISVKISGKNIPATISQLRMAWQKVAPEQAFDYTFLDNNLDKQYRSESRLGQLIGLATGLAILIACLGLFGIATLTIAQRTKEIGVRKVLGATVAGIVGLLSKDFLKLVLFALVIASPVAYFFMDNWLADFAYRISIQWWVFLLTGTLAVVVAFLTVSFQSVRAALANPVESLRSE